MIRPTLILWVCSALIVLAQAAFAQNYAGRKVLHVNSYHLGYEGSDPITQGIREVLEKQGVNLKIIYMDTKRNLSEEFSREAALKAKAVIEEFKPEVVIASDDNASKYLIMPYYKDANLPFVFCGVNWDASVYGFPYKNVTGMIEVALVSEILRHLKNYAKGNRIGFIAADTLSERKNLEYYIKRFGVNYDKVYLVKTFAEWKQAFANLQNEVDMITMTSHAGIPDWNEEEARRFVLVHIQVPVGTEHGWEMPLALVGVTKDFEEMGMWSANAALKILDGVQPSQIPITANKKGRLLFNVTIAKKLGITSTPPLAEIIR